MIKQIILIAIVLGIGVLFQVMSHAPAFAVCTGNPHDSGSTGNPHDTGDTGNPHDTVAPPGSHLGHEADTCNGAK